MRKIKLENLSIYRNELMGISLIFIMLCHAATHQATLSKSIINGLVFFNIGVDMFLFLSGFGIYYSLTKVKNLNSNICKWYIGKFVRILKSYLIIESPFWLIYCLYNGQGIIGFIYYISFISYWYEGIGTWFLVLLLPLYFISPIIFSMFSGKYRFISLLILIVLVEMFSIKENTFDSYNLHHFFMIFKLLLSRVPSFILGMYLGRKIKNNQYVSFYFIIMFLVVFEIMKFTPIVSEVFRAWLLTVPICFIMTIIFDFFCTMKLIYINKILSFLGKRTLEIYIFYDISVNTIQLLCGKGDLLYYGSMVLGLAGGISYNWISSRFMGNHKKG